MFSLCLKLRFKMNSPASCSWGQSSQVKPWPRRSANSSILTKLIELLFWFKCLRCFVWQWPVLKLHCWSIKTPLLRMGPMLCLPLLSSWPWSVLWFKMCRECAHHCLTLTMYYPILTKPANWSDSLTFQLKFYYTSKKYNNDRNMFC